MRSTQERGATGATAAMAAMLGAGLFGGLAPATSAAGPWVLAGIVVAAVIAAVLATVDPGPADVNPRAGPGLGVWADHLSAGLALLGRITGAMAVAAVFGAHLLPAWPAAASVVLVTAVCVVTALGWRPPPGYWRLSVLVVVAVLAMVVAVSVGIEPAGSPVAVPPGAAGTPDPWAIPTATGLMFFTFLGFDHALAPAGRPPHRSALVAVGAVAVISLGVAAAALHQLGGPRLALSPTPLRDALAAADAVALDPLLVLGAGVAAMSTLLAVLAGVRLPPGATRPGRWSMAVVGVVVAAGASVLVPAVAIAVASGAMLTRYVLVALARRVARGSSGRRG